MSTLVASGGVASNGALQGVLHGLARRYSARFLVPPPALCQDNGIMIAWTGMSMVPRLLLSHRPGIEYLRLGRGICMDPAALRYHPQWPLGDDVSQHVAEAEIRLPRNLRKLPHVKGD